MKRHIDIQELVSELKKENLLKRDFVIPSANLSMRDGKIVIANHSKNPDLDKILYECGISSVASGTHEIVLDRLDTIDPHLIDKLSIPTKYFDKMDTPEDIAALDYNVTYWFQRAKCNYLLRTFIDKAEETGVARAMLSDRFKTIDNYDVMLATLQAVKETGLKIDIDGCDLSDKRMYIRFVCPEIEIQAPELIKNYRPNGQTNKVGDGIVSGFVISNSEVGAGQFSIAARAKVLVCGNGMISTTEKYNQRHLGSKIGEFETIQWSEDTKQKNLELIISQIKDSIKEYVSEDCLGRQIKNLMEKGGYEVKHPVECIQQVTSSLGISEEKSADILSFFIKSGDTTAFGVSQALTLFAHTKGDADEQFDMERQAVDILDTIKEFDKPVVRKSVKSQTVLN